MNHLIILPRFNRVNGCQLPSLTPPAEVGAELAAMASIHRTRSSEYSQQAAARIRILQSAIKRQSQPDDFGVVLWSVGNPDFGQYHGPGEGSPTMLVCVPMLRDIQEIVAAYIGCFDLGGGNCSHFPVFRQLVHVSNVSYNGRLWTPETHREIDPTTGKEF